MTHKRVMSAVLHAYLTLHNIEFIPSSIHLSSRLCMHPFIHPLTHSLISSLIHAFIQSVIQSFISSYVKSLCIKGSSLRSLHTTTLSSAASLCWFCCCHDSPLQSPPKHRRSEPDRRLSLTQQLSSVQETTWSGVCSGLCPGA